MKLTQEKIEECAAWIEENGLYPQAGGASIGTFCRAMGIDPTTWRRWQIMPEMHEALSRAREAYSTRTIFNVESALIRKAIGSEGIKRRTQTDRAGNVVTTEETFSIPPDDDACVFLLTNLAPDRWRKSPEPVEVHSAAGLRIVDCRGMKPEEYPAVEQGIRIVDTPIVHRNPLAGEEDAPRKSGLIIEPE